MLDMIKESADEHMKKALESLDYNFASVRTGRANAMVLDRIKVDYYGVPTPVNQVAAVKSPDAHLLVIEPWEKSMLRAIEHAILASDLGVTPSNDGNCIRLPFPQLTEERRKELAKDVKKKGDAAKTAVRNIRRDGNDAFKKSNKAKEISEDEYAELQEKLQKITDKYVAMVDKAVEAKTKEIMTV